MQIGLVLKGILYLTLVPVILLVSLLLSLYFPLLDSSSLLSIILFSLFMFFVILFRPNAYTDSEVLEMVEVPNAPEKILVMLKTRTFRGGLVNISLISILGRKKKLSQTDLVKHVGTSGVMLSHPAIAKYIFSLVELGIFDSKKGEYNARAIEYVLTAKGEWCYKAIRKCFPKRFFFFVIRHYLGIRDLPEFPRNN